MHSSPDKNRTSMPPHLSFGMNTLSFLYSHDLKLLDIRSVPLPKLFCVSISPRNMPFLHDQVHRVASTMLDSAFVFVEKSPLEGGSNRVDAYCLSHPSWGAAAAAAAAAAASSGWHHASAASTLLDTPATPSSAGSSFSCCSSSAVSPPPSTAPPGSSSSTSRRMRISRLNPPSTSELRREGFMRKIQDEEEVRAAFAKFMNSPKARYANEHVGEDAESQRRCVESFEKKQLSKEEATPQKSAKKRLSEGEKEEELLLPPNKRHRLLGISTTRQRQMSIDARRVVVPVDCTLATYEEQFADGWMGEMLLEGVVNVPFERLFVPVEVSDRATLIECVMMHARIFNLHVQQSSRLMLARSSSSAAATRGTTTHRFSECNLCKPVAAYEAAGLSVLHNHGHGDGSD